MSVLRYIVILTVPVYIIEVAFVSAKVKNKELVYYADFEHVNMTYWNPKYYSWLNCTARRYSRSDPTHYVSLDFETLVPLGRNLTLDVYMYEFLSNEYRRSFVEFHYNICDLVFKDKFIGPFINQHLPFKTCPFPKAVYNRPNMSIPDLPLLSTFPFKKGRIFVNVTLHNPGAKVERMVEGHVDVVIKTRWR